MASTLQACSTVLSSDRLATRANTEHWLGTARLSLELFRTTDSTGCGHESLCSHQDLMYGSRCLHQGYKMALYSQ